MPRDTSKVLALPEAGVPTRDTVSIKETRLVNKGGHVPRSLVYSSVNFLLNEHTHILSTQIKLQVITRIIDVLPTKHYLPPTRSPLPWLLLSRISSVCLPLYINGILQYGHFVSGFLSSILCSRGLSILLCVVVVSYFLCIPLCAYTTIYY